MELKDLFKHINGMWMRWSAYEIVKGDNGLETVVPTKDAVSSVYDAGAVATEMLVDALNAGRTSHFAPDRDKADREVTLDFMKKYGPLGWFTALPKDRDFYSIGLPDVYLGRNGTYWAKKTLPMNEYYNFFFPKKKPRSRPEVAKTLNKPDEYNVVFSQFYGEPLAWTANVFADLIDRFDGMNPRMRVTQHLHPEDGTPEDGFRYNASISATRGTASFYMKADQGIKMIWELDSLKTMLDTSLALAVTDEALPLKACKHCRKIFYSTNTRSEFCSIRCRNQFNVYKSRAKC